MKRVCIIGCGAIAACMLRTCARAEVWALVRRKEQPRLLNRDGLRVSGTHSFSVTLRATDNPRELPDFDLGNRSYQGDAGEGIRCGGR